jgi:hypothetical protein
MMSVESGNFLKKLANCFAKLPSVIDGYDWKDMASYGKKG